MKFASKAREDWERDRESIAARFKELRGEFCGSLLLIGSVALEEDDCESDIDLAVMTLNGFSFSDADRIVSGMRESFGKRLHIIFMTHKMRECLLDDGGVVACG